MAIFNQSPEELARLQYERDQLKKDPFWKIKQAGLQGQQLVASLLGKKSSGATGSWTSNPTPIIPSGMEPAASKLPNIGYPVVNTGMTPAPAAPAAPAAAVPATPAAQPDFMGKYGSALLPYMSQLQGQEEQAGDIQQQMAQAQSLIDTPIPEGRNSGRVYTAANPLEVIGAGIKQYKGYKQDKEEKKALKALREETKGSRSAFNKAIIDALSGNSDSGMSYHGFQ